MNDKVKKLVIIFGIALAMMACAVRADTNALARVRVALDTLRQNCGGRGFGGLDEVLNFEDGFRSNQPYQDFAAALSNDWQFAICNIGQIATNQTERYFLLGLGKQYGEDTYIDSLGELSDLRTNNVISVNEFIWAKAARGVHLETCLERRYREARVVELIAKLRVSLPDMNDLWDDILSGQAYTNYLDEVAAGCWGQSPPL